MIYKILQIKLKIEQHETPVVNSVKKLLMISYTNDVYF